MVVEGTVNSAAEEERSSTPQSGLEPGLPGKQTDGFDCSRT
jgi:hypothetical protein